MTTTPTNTASSPAGRGGEPDKRLDFPGGRFEGELTLREAALKVVNWFDKDGAAGTLPDYIMDLRSALKATASPDPAGAGGDLGELERLSKAAPKGPWHPDEYEAHDEDGGPSEIACDGICVPSDYFDPESIASCNRSVAAFVCALVNAFRAGKLVASSQIQTDGGGTGEPFGTGYSSETTPSGRGPAGEYPSRIPAYATDFDRISCMCSRGDVEVFARELSEKHRGNEIYALAVIDVYRNGQRVSDEHSQSEDPKGLSPKDASAAPSGETPDPSPQSSPTLKTGGMTVEEASQLLDGIRDPKALADYYRNMARLDGIPRQAAVWSEHAANIETALRILQAAGEVR